MKFTIIAIPHAESLEKLEEIRQFFYLNDFRYTNRKASGVAHITLAQGECDEIDLVELQSNFVQKLNDFKAFDLRYKEVTNKLHERVYHDVETLKKYPDGCCRVALLFDDKILKGLTSRCISILKKANCDTTDQYANNIKQHTGTSAQTSNPLDYVADHMNICNYARIDKGAEAQKVIREIEEIKSIKIDRIAVYSDKNKVMGEIAL